MVRHQKLVASPEETSEKITDGLQLEQDSSQRALPRELWFIRWEIRRRMLVYMYEKDLKTGLRPMRNSRKMSGRRMCESAANQCAS